MQWKTHESTRESPGTPNVNWRQPGCKRQWVRPKTSNQENGRNPSAKLQFLQGKFIPKEIQKHALVNRFFRFIADRVHFLGTDLLPLFLSFSRWGFFPCGGLTLASQDFIYFPILSLPHSTIKPVSSETLQRGVDQRWGPILCIVLVYCSNCLYIFGFSLE